MANAPINSPISPIPGPASHRAKRAEEAIGPVALLLRGGGLLDARRTDGVEQSRGGATGPGHSLGSDKRSVNGGDSRFGIAALEYLDESFYCIAGGELVVR
jgi:hypothetical protein